LHLKDGATNERDDYYAKEGEGGRWLGEGAEALGLAGAVNGNDFVAMAKGFSPDGEALANNPGAANRQAGWDLCFSAPKSVSVLWAVGENELRAKIEAGHAQAIGRAFTLIQDKAGFARAGHDGLRHEKAQLVAAVFQHGTSREAEPQLHSHCFLFNQGKRDIDGEWSSLVSPKLFEWKMAAGAAYRADFAHSLREMGFTIERDGDSFRVAGVPKELEAVWSTRREQILDALRDKGYYSAAAASVAATDTRKAKGEIDIVPLRGEWREQAAAHEFGQGKAEGLAGSEPAPALEALSADQILRQATEHEAVLREQDIYQAAYVAAQGVTGFEGGREVVRDTFAAAVVIEQGNKIRFTTRELAAIEQAIFQGAIARQGETAHHVNADTVSDVVAKYEERRTAELVAEGKLQAGERFRLRDEQRAAIEFLACRSGGVAILVGDAGTGKTTALDALREVYEHAGFKVVGGSIGGKAAAGLEQESGIKSATIARHLIDIERGATVLDAKTIVVIDEAGMTDSRAFFELKKMTDAAEAKLIFVGDYKQLQSVGAGTAFRHLIVAFGDGGHARLEQITRQYDERDREAVRNLSKGDVVKAFNSYIERDLVSVKTTHHHAVQAIAGMFKEDAAAVGVDKVLIAAATNPQVRDINAAVRDALKQDGGLSDGQLFTVQAKIGTREMEIASGDRILITSNDAKTTLRNGDFATVKGLHEHDGKTYIEISVDRVKGSMIVDPQQLQLRHGYAATVHRLQGATAERAIIYGSKQCYREMSYVQGSRSREAPRWVFTQHSVKTMAREAGIETKPGEKPPVMEQLKDVFKAMSTSHQKASTLDYQKASPERAAQVVAGITKQTQPEKTHDKQLAAIREPNAASDTRERAAGSNTSMSKLPGGDVVRDRDASKMLLPANAHSKLDGGREADTAMRRTGESDRGTDRQPAATVKPPAQQIPAAQPRAPEIAQAVARAAPPAAAQNLRREIATQKTNGHVDREASRIAASLGHPKNGHLKTATPAQRAPEIAKSVAKLPKAEMPAANREAAANLSRAIAAQQPEFKAEASRIAVSAGHPAPGAEHRAENPHDFKPGQHAGKDVAHASAPPPGPPKGMERGADHGPEK
jgi:conjugative relaxase-like TrwC/TraI family protein